MRKNIDCSGLLQLTLLLICSLLAGIHRAEAQSTLDQSFWHLHADSLRQAGQIEAAFNWLGTEKTKLEQQNRQQSPDYVAILFAIGKQHFKIRNLDLATPTLQEALDLHRAIAPTDLANQAVLLYALADCYEVSPEPNKAIPLYENALELSLIVYGDNTQQAARGYYEMAIIYMIIERYELANEFCQKAIRCMKNAGLVHHTDYAGYHQVLGLIYQEEGNYRQALNCYQVALPVLRNNLGNHIETAKTLSTIGESYALIGALDSALEYQLTSAAMFEKIDTVYGRYLRGCYTYLGKTYILANQPQKAIEYLRRAQFTGLRPEEKPSAGARLLSALAEAYSLSGDSLHALACIDSALTVMRTTPGTNRIYQSRSMLIKAKILTPGKGLGVNNSPNAEEEAVRLLKGALDLLVAATADFDSERDKRAAYRESVKALDLGVTLSIELAETTRNLDWLQQAFTFSELGKGLLLYHQLLKNKKRRWQDIPLVDSERALRAEITAVKNQIFELDSTAVTARDGLLEQLFFLSNRYARLRDTMQNVYPEYFAKTDTFQSVRLDALQAGMAPNEGLLEFFTGDSSITTFLVLSDALFFQKIQSKKALEKQIAQLRDAITRYHTAPEKSPGLYTQAAADYAESAHTLYQMLLAPFGGKLPPQLTIVPDGALAYLPFEALLVEKPERPDRFNLHHYFGNDHVLRYAPSAALLREMENLPLPHASASQALALAPFFDGSTVWTDSLRYLASRTRLDLSPLPFTGEEVYKIAKMTGGKALTGAEASKQSFIREAPNYPVLHLATHAQANGQAGDYSFLAFPPAAGQKKPDRLYVSDIYGLRLNAELVVLSACETGLGQLLRGEGIVSIARAFSAAGARSIVQSQWVVSDSQTRRLMELFYENLKNGQPKDQALAEAKREYLKKFKGEAAHPYFWSGFILIGDNAPLSFFKNISPRK